MEAFQDILKPYLSFGAGLEDSSKKNGETTERRFGNEIWETSLEEGGIGVEWLAEFLELSLLVVLMLMYA